jgi:hypothetical protein
MIKLTTTLELHRRSLLDLSRSGHTDKAQIILF